MDVSYALDPEALRQFLALRVSAVDEVAQRFEAAHAAEYARFGEPGRKSCREDLAFQLDFLRPVLEFGELRPYVEFQRWLAEVLEARGIPAAHVDESLRWLGEFFQQRLPGGVGATIAQATAEAWRLSRLPAEAEAQPPAPAPAWPERDPFVDALLAGDRKAALRIVRALGEAGRTAAQIDVHLIQAALYEVGERWSRNRVTVAQEHLATATARTVMAEAFADSAFAPGNGRKALFACVEGNEHSVGLQMVADAFELDGWEVEYLGANVPVRSLVSQAEAWGPDLVGLSISFPQQLGAGRETIRLLRERLGERCPRVLVGGNAVNRFRDLAVYLGADAYAGDALAALHLVQDRKGPA